jgi:hypothetical protein
LEDPALSSLWAYYDSHKPKEAWRPRRLIDPSQVLERDEQLAQVAEYVEADFAAYQERADHCQRYALPVCWGAAGSGKTTFGDLVVARLASVVRNADLKQILERRSQYVMLEFNGGGDKWTADEERRIEARLGEGIINSACDHGLALRLLARGILQIQSARLLAKLNSNVLAAATVADAMRVTGRAVREREQLGDDADVGIVIHFDEYQLIEPDASRRAMMRAIAEYCVSGHEDHVFVVVLFTGTSMRSAGRGLERGSMPGLTEFAPKYFAHRHSRSTAPWPLSVPSLDGTLIAFNRVRCAVSLPTWADCRACSRANFDKLERVIAFGASVAVAEAQRTLPPTWLVSLCGTATRTSPANSAGHLSTTQS